MLNDSVNVSSTPVMNGYLATSISQCHNEIGDARGSAWIVCLPGGTGLTLMQFSGFLLVWPL